jgi:dCMP deaminase
MTTYTDGPGPPLGDHKCNYPVRPSRDETWLRVAEVIAERGTCPRRQVGCVIVDMHGRVMATGYNGPASGRPHCSEGEPCPGAHFRSGEGLDKCEAIHAEQNACLLLDDPWQVDTVYITASPCLSCVKLLLGTSAKRIVCRELYPHADAIEWWGRAGRQLTQLNRNGTELDYGHPV